MSKTTSLPIPIRLLIQNMNNRDQISALKSFGLNALVHVSGRYFRGVAEIKEWIDEEILKNQKTFEVDKIIMHEGDYIISVIIYNNLSWDSSEPLRRELFFYIRDGLIIRLIITNSNH